jgi:hypothetical protein
VGGCGVTGKKNSGRIDYKTDGYALSWDNRGLSIETTDYKPGILRLSWATVLDLAKRAGQVVDSASGGITTDSRGREGEI